MILAYILLILSGCSHIKEIQFQSYAVGLGMDYKDDEYHVVLQFLDFSNVAKTEQGKSADPSPVWLATGKGKTIEEAFTKIYQGIQIPINFDQLSIFIFGKSLLENRLSKTLQALDTNFNVRLTGSTYGTEESIEEIFTTKLPFYYAFSNARVMQPEQMQQQDSAVPAISLQELLYQFNEKTKTILLPNISIEDAIIKRDLKSLPVSTIKGAFIMKGEKMKGLLNEKDLNGFVRMNNKAVRSPVTLSEDQVGEKEFVQVEVLKPKVKRTVKKEGSDVQIGLDLRVSAIIRESSHEIDSSLIKKKIKEEIRSEVYTAYLKSRELGGDIYQFEDYLYRFMHDDWREFQSNGNFPVLKKKDIQVKIDPLKSINKVNSTITPLFNKVD
ncbi:Ger(x)C family spore germination protein [Neobacillus jeddahensis]|uniref:Ger(x)C family spore germination protein n=1 Tax=Neobacillus jeddahensis TaxID=1461580 RepID=UPI001FCB8CD9|nr:Ger(x)C family spore germination protein [Neobacillus jeddahensis]